MSAQIRRSYGEESIGKKALRDLPFLYLISSLIVVVNTINISFDNTPKEKIKEINYDDRDGQEIGPSR